MNDKEIKWKKEYENEHALEDRTVDALLLAFDEEIFMGYTIPNSHRLASFTGIAIREICGAKPDLIYQFDSGIIGWNILPHKEKLQNRLQEGLTKVITCAREENSILDLNMLGFSRKIYSEWFSGYGELYSFRRGEEEKASEKVNSFFTKEELENYSELYKIMRRECKKEYTKK